MDSKPYQFGLKDLLLLPVIGLAAIGVNSSLDFVLFDIERWWLHLCLESLETANWYSKLPGFIIRFIETIASRGVDMAAVTLVAVLLVSLGKRTHSAAFLLLVTMPFSPQIGFDSFSFYFRNNQWLEGWPELAIALMVLIAIGALAMRASDQVGSRTQQLALVGFFLIGVLGWWRLNPHNVGSPISMACHTRQSDNHRIHTEPGLRFFSDGNPTLPAR